MNGDSNQEDFKPREYQIELFEKVVKRNSIIFLPTGCGKTFIATMVIKYHSKSIEKKYSLGGKRTFFLVNTVTLVEQQADSLSRHLPFQIGKYSGDLGVDYWDKAKWENELENHEVLVMTAQIFLDLLLHSYLPMTRVNLIVMDECHHAVNKHAMRQIMTTFETVKIEERPHILGLTATLLLGNIKPHRIKEEIHNLEVTMHSKICRASNEEMLKAFSTRPVERVEYFEVCDDSRCSEFIIDTLNNAIKYLNLIQIGETKIENEGPYGAQRWNFKKDESKKLKNMLSEILICSRDLGAYATSYALLSRLITLERIRLSTSDNNLRSLCSMLSSVFHSLRKMIHDEMEKYTIADRIFEFSSPKMKKLFSLLKHFKKDDAAIIFVTRRITAKILYYIFDDVSKEFKAFQCITPDYVVGLNTSAFNDTRESLLERKRNSETLKRFNSGESNVLFASDVVEEGVDIQLCNFVIKFDNPSTLCSYIQSKGRARHKDSTYIIMAPNLNTNKPFSNVYEEYKEAEEHLKNELSYGKDELRTGGTEAEAQLYLYSKEIEPFQPYGSNGPIITVCSSISLLNRYVSMLPQDKFSKLTVAYWKETNKDQYITIILQLPINSPLKGFIKGLPCRNLPTAKASAALEACKQLFEHGEFDSNLLPVGHQIEIDDSKICPLWTSEPSEAHLPKPGTKKRYRLYVKRYPEAICKCTPKANKKTYLHLIKCTPNYECPNSNRHVVFFDLLKSSTNFAILTSKKWPKICNFPMFMNVGRVDIELQENYMTMKFTEQELKEIFDFHCLVVTEVFELVKRFLTKDYEDGENSYYFIPVKEVNESLQVDWETIRNHHSIPEPKPVPVESRGYIDVTKDKYHGKIVIPWYRPKGYMLRYIVTKVCEDETPLSPFPSENYESYTHYFSERYNQRIVNVNQPLIEVRAISSKNTCILPRGRTHGKKRRRDEDDLEETLVPELCTLLEFPSVYMLKATLLPSVMHRITLLLLAEEVRQEIAIKVGLGTNNFLKDFSWDPLTLDNATENNFDEHPSQQKSTIEISNMLANKMEELNPRDCPWDKDEEPKDIERNIKSVDLLSITYYHKFSNEKISPDLMKIGSNESTSGGYIRFRKTNFQDFSSFIEAPEIPILKASPDSLGPQLADVVQAIIPAAANDIVNYERLETLGDAFLKFMTSLVLFVSYPKMDEGKLTYLKGKIIGNRNLFYCGRQINLGSIIKAIAFAAEDWDVPHYNLLPSIKSLLKEAKIPPGLMYKITLSKDERESGLIDEKTYQQILDLCCNSQETEDISRTSINIIGEQVVQDKTIADSVEALIGVYLKACGIEGAARLCKWLQIFPEDLSDLKLILKDPFPSALLNPLANVNSFLVLPEQVEHVLQYRFNDRSYLLQALTHSSYTQTVTDCYQRLEFLGDALLDFLITTHIYNTCANLSPGDLTDLRSALVNNVTFACLVARYGFYKHLLSKACKLSEVVSNFVYHQEKRNHKIGAEVLFLINEVDVQVGQAIDVPKVLGDIFESLAAAIYLDSGKSLETVWRVYYRLMHREIEEFSKDVPKNNIRLLYEKFPSPLPYFRKATPLKNGRGLMIQLCITHNGETHMFFGVGENKNQAKLAAAKVALRHFHNCRTQ